MFIRSLKIEGFGIFDSAGVSELDSGLTVFYGRNEAGKTTLFQFLRGMLYGLEQRDRLRYLDRTRGKTEPACGGELQIHTEAGREYCIKRTAIKGERDSWTHHLVLDDGAPSPHAARSLDELCGGVDESTFTNVYSVGLAELQQLSLLDETDAAALLYRLTSGLDRTSLVDVLDAVLEARTNLYSRDGNGGKIGELLRRQRECASRVAELSATAKHWSRLASRCGATETKLQNSDTVIDDLRRQIRLHAIADECAAEYHELLDLKTGLGHLHTTVPVFFATFDGDPLEALDQLSHSIHRSEEDISLWSEARRELTEERDELEIRSELLSHAARIDALGEMTGWIASQHGQLEAVQTEVQRLETQHTELYGAEQTCADGRHIADVLSGAVVAQLRGPARALKEIRQRSHEAQTSLAEARRELESRQQKMDAAAMRSACSNLDEELETTANEKTSLTRRLEDEDRAAQLKRAERELNESIAAIPGGELLTLREAILTGSLFVVGFVLIFAPWLLGAARGISSLLSLLGLLVLPGSALLKSYLLRSRRQAMKRSADRLQLVSQQMAEIELRIRSHDGILGLAGGPLDVRRQRCDERLKELESLVPLQAAVRAAEHNVSSIEVRLEHLSRHLSEAQERWQEEIQRHGLPDSLLPSHVRRHVANQKHMSDHARILQVQKEEAERLSTEIAGQRQRIGRLYLDSGLQPAGDNVVEMIRDLQASVSRERGLLKQREKIDKKRKRLKKKLRRGRQLIHDQESRRQFMFRQAGCEDEASFRRQASEQREVIAKRHHLIAVDKHLTEALGPDFERTELEQLWQGTDLAGLIDQRAILDAELEKQLLRRDKLLEKRGELVSRMRQLEGDDSLPIAQFELRQIENQLEVAFQQWQVWELSHFVLMRVREEFELERQPETLRVASRWLEEMTAGKYTRLWTPIDEDALYLDDAENQIWRLDSLSSGTREMVYLSLRLALVEGFRQRGVGLPMVLDDVLVNLDSERACKAVESIIAFAQQGHQVIFFTCHDHIRELFQEAGVDSRELSGRRAQAPRLRQSSPQPHSAQATPESDDLIRMDAAQQRGDDLGQGNSRAA